MGFRYGTRVQTGIEKTVLSTSQTSTDTDMAASRAGGENTELSASVSETSMIKTYFSIE